MPEFLTLLPPPQALETLLAYIPARLGEEEIPTADALGRVTFAAVQAPHPLPAFARSTVDGYAVRAADTFGASDALPAYLQLAGEVPMGAAPAFSIAAAECALIHTGGMLPGGADAVVMVEHTQQAGLGAAQHTLVEVLRAVGVGENALQVGEDVAAGQDVIATGQRLRPAEIGGLMALGLTRVQVARKPRVGIISSGDEVVPPEVAAGPGQVRDVNSYTLAALVAQSGGEPVLFGIVQDDFSAMQAAVGQALEECDLVVITAGSSASTRDLTARVIDSLGAPGVLVHGVNVRPGKPTILAVCGDKPLVGLPGNPVSALVIAGLFVVPLIERLLGLAVERPHPSVPAHLSLNLASQSGREDWVPVRLVETESGVMAEPVFGKSNLIFTLARADGLVRIPADANGLESGAQVEVHIL
jgi:molybdopterin molybdotransferase